MWVGLDRAEYSEGRVRGKGGTGISHEHEECRTRREERWISNTEKWPSTLSSKKQHPSNHRLRDTYNQNSPKQKT